LLPQPPPPPPAKVRVVVANDVVKKGEVRKDNNKGDLLSSSRRICCFPSKLRWAAFRHSLVGFQTSSKSFRKHARSSHKLRFDQTGFNSHDLFWSEEEVRASPPPTVSGLFFFFTYDLCTIVRKVTILSARKRASQTCVARGLGFNPKS
jgi:hypothetical protein